MEKTIRRGEQVTIISADYGPVSGLTGTVTEDYSSDFRVSLGSFEVQIKNPAVDLKPVPVEVGKIAGLLVAAKSWLPKDATFETKPGGTIVVRMPENQFRNSFEEFGYEMSHFGSGFATVTLVATIDKVEFRASASSTTECIAEAETWIAAHPEPEEAAAS